MQNQAAADSSVDSPHRHGTKGTGSSETLVRVCDAIKPVLGIKPQDDCDGQKSYLGTHITVPKAWVTQGKLNSKGQTYLRKPELQWYVSILYPEPELNCWGKYPYHLAG